MPWYIHLSLTCYKNLCVPKFRVVALGISGLSIPIPDFMASQSWRTYQAADLENWRMSLMVRHSSKQYLGHGFEIWRKHSLATSVIQAIANGFTIIILRVHTKNPMTVPIHINLLSPELLFLLLLNSYQDKLVT